MRDKLVVYILMLVLTGLSCKDHAVPKNRGYLRIDLPIHHVYAAFEASELFAFEASQYGHVSDLVDVQSGKWFNVAYPQWKGMIYLSYFNLNDTSLQPLTEDARRFAYKHAIKATSIDESVFRFNARRVYGTLYEVGGDAASAVQFFATDSTTHFLMGSLYFNCVPNRDSLNPVINFVRADILHMIETLEWKE